MTVQPLVSPADTGDDDNVVLAPDLQSAPCASSWTSSLGITTPTAGMLGVMNFSSACKNYWAVYRPGLGRDLRV